jgi:DNA-binding response OmpR family regulator
LRPALILVDLLMPRMDGWRLIEVIRENREYAGTQFVIVSGQGSNDSVDRAHALGISYLSKLGDLNELVALVEQRIANAKRRT